jgi:hypothetical protein
MCFSHFTITKRENGYVNVIIYHDINMYYPLHQGIAIQIIQVFFFIKVVYCQNCYHSILTMDGRSNTRFSWSSDPINQTTVTSWILGRFFMAMPPRAISLGAPKLAQATHHALRLRLSVIPQNKHACKFVSNHIDYNLSSLTIFFLLIFYYFLTYDATLS